MTLCKLDKGYPADRQFVLRMPGPRDATLIDILRNAQNAVHDGLGDAACAVTVSVGETHRGLSYMSHICIIGVVNEKGSWNTLAPNQIVGGLARFAEYVARMAMLPPSDIRPEDDRAVSISYDGLVHEFGVAENHLAAAE